MHPKQEFSVGESVKIVEGLRAKVMELAQTPGVEMPSQDEFEVMADEAMGSAKEHIDKIIKDRLIVAVNPEEYSEDVLKSMLEEFVGLKVWSN